MSSVENSSKDIDFHAITLDLHRNLFFKTALSLLQAHHTKPEEEGREEDAEIEVEDLGDEDGRPLIINVLTLILLL